MRINVFLCACADGSMLSVRVCTQRMRWNKLLMRALPAHPAPHMFPNPWVSFENDTMLKVKKLKLRSQKYLQGIPVFTDDLVFLLCSPSAFFCLWSQ